jgi:NAD-dependent deacetylase sirtuin 2
MGTTPSTLDNSPQVTLQDIVNSLKFKKFKNIIVMAGAGISTSCGIPDFRTPGTGLYDNLQRFNLPNPEAMFTLDFFKKNPQPFYTLAKELLPGSFQPSTTHKFIKLLQDQGILLRCYTQNIDGLEQIAGVFPNLIFQVHGGFDSAHCVECGAVCDMQEFKKSCPVVLKCKICKLGYIKPDIVFFGESMPKDFGYCVERDFPICDCLIVLGTSLKVQPFAYLINKVPSECPRLLINREQVFTNITKRDVFLKGDCDTGVKSLCNMISNDWEHTIFLPKVQQKDVVQNLLSDLKKYV